MAVNRHAFATATMQQKGSAANQEENGKRDTNADTDFCAGGETVGGGT